MPTIFRKEGQEGQEGQVQRLGKYIIKHPGGKLSTRIRLLSLRNEIKLKLIEFILQHRSNEGTASSVVFQK